MAKTYNFRERVPCFIYNTLANFTAQSKKNFLQPQVNKLNFYEITQSFFPSLLFPELYSLFPT